MEKVMVSIRFPEELLKKVDAEAAANKRSRSYVITEYVEKAYSNGNPTPAPKAQKKAKGK
jgi:metal-responsive CopG/Arc/MetJ family transcriptional regulator